MSGNIVLTGSQIPVARLIVLRSALRLEVLGFTRRGPSVYSIVKREFGLKGSKQSVYDQFNAIVEDAKRNSLTPPAA
jgi:hypothetical protein